MALGDVIFNKGKGGLGRPLAGTDYVSGLLFYSSILPSGFTTTDRIKTIFSVEDAVNLGIKNTSLGETKATGTVTIATAGVVNDVINIKAVTDITTIDLGSAIVPTSPTVTNVASAVVVKINSGSITHGFTATSAVGVVTITAPIGSGLGANTWTLTITVTGAATTTNVAFAGGVASEIDILYYHVSEFFRVQPKGKLFVGVYTTADVGTFASVTLMQNFALGQIKQLGVYQKTSVFATAQVTTLQGVADALEVLHKPLQLIYQADFTGVTLASLVDIKGLNSKNVSVTIGQDGGAKGYTIYRATKKSIGCLGTTLGAVAMAKVNESIRWIGKFNMATSEYDTLAFANGDFYLPTSDGTIVNIDLLGYIFLKKEIDIVGSYHNKPHTCIAYTSDYTYIYNNRTIDKAIRSIRANLLPQLASPIVVNANGTLSEDVIGFFNSLCDRALEVMQRDTELSAFSVIIDPSQNVLSTNQLVIAVKLVPVGVADTIIVNIGFTLNI